MNTIIPYWDNDSGTWVFDEPNVGLIKEPFVLGVPEMIDGLVKDIPGARDGFKLSFSSSPISDQDYVLSKLQADMGGWWYQDKDGRKGWLCPAMFLFFTQAPELIHVQVNSL